MMKHNRKIDQRREKMLEIIKENSVISTTELSEIFSVSPETIRKDIDYLDKRELVTRIHGGVAPKDSTADEKSYSDRSCKNLEEKKRIAQAACERIQKGDSIILDNGTTVDELVGALVKKPELLSSLTIVTMAFRVVETLRAHDFQKIFFLGGWIRPGDEICYGQHTLQLLQNIHVDKAFISCAGVTEQLKVTDYFDEEVALRQQFLRQSGETILLADSSKMKKTTMFSICDVRELDYLITDCGCPGDMRAAFAQAGITCKLV